MAMEPKKKHLAIVGGGSAAFAAAIRAAELGHTATIINAGLPTGGTCVNVGCVPSKTLIRAAEFLHLPQQKRFEGIETDGTVTSFQQIIAQKNELVGQLRESKYVDIVSANPSIEIVHGYAKIVDPQTVSANNAHIKCDKMLIATGASPFVPPIHGIESVDYLDNESAFELDELPDSLIVVGGRYIALEMAQLFSRLGSKVTILQRSDRILPSESPDVTEELGRHLRSEGIEIVTDVTVRELRQLSDGSVEADIVSGGEQSTIRASHLLMATGRRPNTLGLGLETIGVETSENGFVVVDDRLQTSVPGVYASGDVIGGSMFVYTAAYEGALAAENALTESGLERDYTALPWVVFTDPQVAGVGLDEQQAHKRSISFDVATLPMSHVPRCLAARDTRGFIKLIREKETDRLIGARIVAPEASELLMEISMAIKHKLTVADVAGMFHPYLTLGEAVKLAAISFGKDIDKLSCCAV